MPILPDLLCWWALEVQQYVGTPTASHLKANSATGGSGVCRNVEKVTVLCYRNIMRYWTLRLIFLVLLVCAGSSARAYVLPASQILKRMAKQLGPARTLTVFQKTVLYDPGLDEGMQELEETLYYQYPGRFRSEMNRSQLSRVLQVVNMDESVTVVGDRVVRERQVPFDHFKDVLLYKDVDLLMDGLYRLGIDLETVSLGRFKQRIAYVIGARYPDDSRPQLWVDKERFIPIRLVLDGNGQGTTREIEYEGFAGLDDKNRYPSRILFLDHGRLVRMCVLEAFEINSFVSDALFDVATIKMRYEPEPSALPREKGSELDEVKKSIRDFRRIFE
ncbi:MAG: hypothetical protein JRI36_01065 [Deltaproteobacteria bacterium]|nr:hypothetical protein [Deltaproteobacteria bacterium]